MESQVKGVSFLSAYSELMFLILVGEWYFNSYLNYAMSPDYKRFDVKCVLI